MKANLIRNLKNRIETVEVQEGQTVAHAFPDIDLENSIIIINGKKQQQDYILKKNDIVTIRQTPAGVTTAIIVATAVVAVTAGVVGGIALYKSEKARKEAQEEMDRIKKQTNQPSIDNRPFLRGGENTVALGASQPYVIGRHFFTPYLHCLPFYTLEGTDGHDQYINYILECGYNSQVLKKINIENITIKNFEKAAEPQQGVFTFDAGQIFAEGMGEITQNGELLKSLTNLNYKNVSTPYNEEVTKEVDVAAGKAPYTIFTLNENAMDVDVAVTFPALFGYNDSGDRIAAAVTITPEYSLDGGKSWIGFLFNNNGTATNYFNRNETKELRFVAHKDFTFSDYQQLANNQQLEILVRVRSDGAAGGGKIKNDCYVLYLQSRCFDPNKSSTPAGIVNDAGAAGLVPCLVLEDRERKYCTLLGLKIKATKNNEKKLKKTNIITNGTARVWDGQNWSIEKKPTANLGAWALEVMTSPVHPASRFDDTELDLDSFGELYEHCEKNKINYNLVITNNAKKLDTMQNMLTAAGAVLYRDMLGRWAVAIDQPKENALAVGNSQNVISLKNRKTFSRLTDGIRVKYIDAAGDLYRENTYLLMREVNGQPLPITPDSIIREVQLVGITDHEQAMKYARRMMAVELLRNKVTTIEVGNEGIFYTPMSKFLIQHPSLKIGTGDGVISSVFYNEDQKLTRIKIRGFLTFEEGKNYGIIVNAFNETAAVPLPVKVAGQGYTDTLFIQTDITAADAVRPEAGNTFSFGELTTSGNFGKVATPYLISNINRNGRRFTLDLVNYNTAIYDSGTIPPYRSNLTEPPAEVPAIPPYISAKDGKDGQNGKSGLTIFSEVNALVYQANADGEVEAQQQLTEIHVEQNGNPVPFTIGEIESPAGFAIFTIGKTVYIKALKGSSMAKEGIIIIPLIYREIINSKEYGDQDLNVYVDGLGDVYAQFDLAPQESRFNIKISYAKSIQGVKGENGATGEAGPAGDRGARYWGTEKPAQPVKGDFYLNTQSLFLYEFRNNEWQRIDYTDDRYNQAIPDMNAYIENAGTEALAVVNAWVDNLAAGTILAEKIFTKQLSIKDQGYIQSYNYISGKRGFRLDANGDAEFRNATVEGTIYANDGIFKGDLNVKNMIVNITSGDFYIGTYLVDYSVTIFEIPITIPIGQGIIVNIPIPIATEGSTNFTSPAKGTIKLTIHCLVANKMQGTLHLLNNGIEFFSKRYTAAGAETDVKIINLEYGSKITGYFDNITTGEGKFFLIQAGIDMSIHEQNYAMNALCGGFNYSIKRIS